jgi:NADP-reducing hydrogenase subunit HndC
MDQATLESIKQKRYEEIKMRLTHESSPCKHIMVCGGSGCHSAKSGEIIKELRRLIKKEDLEDSVEVVQTGCFGLCTKGPIVIVQPDDTFYSHVKVEDANDIISMHIKDNTIVERLLAKEADGSTVERLDDLTFYKKQQRLVLRHCGLIDPERIEDYIALDGYKALEKCLFEMTPQEVVKEVKDSGLRGRGGAGFSTGTKWEICANVEGDVKYVACNADEGDPGAFMDRSILEGDPHTVIEAMAIAAYAIGAKYGYIYVRAEYPMAVHRLSKAIEQARERGLLGHNILGTDFSFDLEIRYGAGAFVCGEETALLNSVEGKRGEPRPRPPFPAQKGLFEKPTLLNNVETYANITQIILRGAKWYSSIGTERSKGTKVFALGGKINNVGLVEVPMGITLREIIYDIGGGIPNNKEFKAAQTGGPSGGCLPASLLDIPVEYDELVKAGSMMGSGGLIVMDEDNCMIDIAKFYLDFTVDESCGKCSPCRIGTMRLYQILDKITKGKGTLEDIDKLEELGLAIKDMAVCGLGQSAPNPVLSTLKHFRSEYEAHVVDKVCPAGVCKDLVQYTIDPDKCKGCTLCSRNCPVGAIKGAIKQVHEIDPNVCIKCGLCMTKCKFKAISIGKSKKGDNS